MMRLETEQGAVWTAPFPQDPKKVVVKSRIKRTLFAMLDTIALAGTADDFDYDDIAIVRVHDATNGTHFEMVLDRGTLILWFDFEMQYFQHIERPHYVSET